MEVLISIGVLSIGLLGVAALIPIGKLAMIETNRSDRTGACGRAALRDLKVRRMLDPFITPTDARWRTSTGTDASGYAANNTPVVIDPLGMTRGLPATIGTVPRITLKVGTITLIPDTGASTTNRDLADSMFRWNDELTFDMPADATRRPRGFVQDNTGRVAPYPVLPGEPALVGTPIPVSPNEGNFSWFLTVTPAASEATLPVAQKRQYTVAVAVCYKRVLTHIGVVPDGEHTASVTFLSPIQYGGGAVTLAPLTAGVTLNVKENDWIMLCDNAGGGGVATKAEWYRVANAASFDTTLLTQTLCLVGPDWPAGTTTFAVIIDRVTGVYTTTVQLDQQ